MKARLESLSPRALYVLAGVVVLVYAAAVWMLLVSPKRADATAAKADLVAAEQRLLEAQASAAGPRGTSTPVSDVLRLSKAMPTSEDQTGLVLEITRIAQQSGVKILSLAPQEPVAGEGGPTLIPVQVAISGSYRQITRFLTRTRTLVKVRDGKIRATGRLLAVQSVSLGESVTDGFPKLDATISMDAYVYDGPIVPVDIPEPAEELPAAGSDAASSGAAGSTS